MKIGLDALKEVVYDMQTSVNQDQRYTVPAIMTMLTSALSLGRSQVDEVLTQAPGLLKVVPAIKEKLTGWLETVSRSGDLKPLIENGEKYDLYLYQVVPPQIIDLTVQLMFASPDVAAWMPLSLPFPVDWDVPLRLADKHAKALVQTGMPRIRAAVAARSAELAAELDEEYILLTLRETLAAALFHSKMRSLTMQYHERLQQVKASG